MSERVLTYHEAARVIALYLDEYCDKSLPYSNMIAEAARKASEDIVKLKNSTNPCGFSGKRMCYNCAHSGEQFKISVQTIPVCHCNRPGLPEKDRGWGSLRNVFDPACEFYEAKTPGAKPAEPPPFEANDNPPF